MSTQSPDTRPEHALLLACAHAHVDTETAARLQLLLARSPDWASVLAAARKHGVTPLLYHALASSAAETVPKDTLEGLRREFRANSLRNLLLTKELLRILRHLESGGVRAVPYKGPLLAEAVYGDLSLRHFADLDILVRREDVSKASESLAALGYHLSLEGNVPRAAYLQSMHHFTFVRDNGLAPLELHWGVAERYFAFSLDTDRLWERLQTANLAGAAVPSLAPEDLILVLCVHGSKHGWEGLNHICDVAELVRANPGMNWEQALQQARATGGERMLFLGLALASNLLGATLPEGILRTIEADSAARNLCAEVIHRLLSEAEVPRDASERARFFRFHLRVRERLRDRVRCCLHLVFTPSQEDWQAVRLPESLSFLHYALRPFRLAFKYSARLWNRRR